MSSICLKIITVLCLCCTALSSSEDSRAWRNVGQSVTIQCQFSGADQESLALMKGLEDHEVFFMDKDTGKITINDGFKKRLQHHGKFPNLDILIKNVTEEDTAPYWCEYRKLNIQSGNFDKVKGTGSILLIVTDKSEKPTECDESNKSLVLVSILISAAVLVGIILAFLIWILKTRRQHTAAKPSHINNNDVYEDMRGTIRR